MSLDFIRQDHANTSNRRVGCDVGEFRQIERVIECLGPFDCVYHCAAPHSRQVADRLGRTAGHRSRAVWQFVQQQKEGVCGWNAFPAMLPN